jgi:large subunit ribosomal protein L7/L12
MALSNEEILNAVAEKTVMELVELIKAFEEKFGVSAAAVAVAAGAAPAAVVEEQTEFNVILTSFGANKVNVIKAIREAHRPGPEGSQGSGGRRSANREGRRSKDEAAAVKKKLEEAGATADVK